MIYSFYFDLSNPRETVVDGAEEVANDRINQHENPQNNIATKTRIKAFYMSFNALTPKSVYFFVRREPHKCPNKRTNHPGAATPPKTGGATSLNCGVKIDNESRKSARYPTA